ncbi:hydrophobin-251 [Lyophyllum atratum]|nr:hydrophobin-251 [Lyophyllum atratum]
MQFKSSLLVFATLTTLAAATPTRRTEPAPASQCNTGSLQCCNTLQSATSDPAAGLLALLGIVVQDVTAQVGVTCSPISVLGVGGNSCTAQPVCCTGNTFHGVVTLGCSPVNLSL